MEEAIADIGVKLHCILIVGSFYYVPMIVAYINRKIKDKRKRMIYFLALLSLYLLPLRQCNFIKNNFIWDLYEKYFNIKIVNIANVPIPNKSISDTRSNKNIYGVIPHGIVPFSLGLLQYGKLNEVFGGLRITMASIVKYIPVFGQLLTLGGGIDASYDNLLRHLKSDHYGSDIAISPGGILEMFYSDTSGYKSPSLTLPIVNETNSSGDSSYSYSINNSSCSCSSKSFLSTMRTSLQSAFVARRPANEYIEFAVLRHRKGFIRLAIESGADIVPVYCFGSSLLFKEFKIPLLEALSRRLKASIMPFYGQYYLPIPFKVDLVYAVGKAIKTSIEGLPLNRSPVTSDEIDFLHNTFINSIRLLFDTNKQSYGWGDKIIKFI